MPVSEVAGFPADRVMSVAKMMAGKMGHVAFKELRMQSGMSGKDVATAMSFMWSEVLGAIRRRDEEVIREIVPEGTCASCIGCCGGRKQKVADIWDETEMCFNGTDCEHKKTKDEFAVKMQSVSVMCSRGRMTKYSMDSSGILKVENGPRVLAGTSRQVRGAERTLIADAESAKRHILSMLDDGFEIMEMLPNEDDYRVRGMDVVPGEGFRSYMDRIHDALRSRRRSIIDAASSMTDEQISAEVRSKIAASKIGGVMSAFGDDFGEFLAVYFPDKTIREIYMEMSR